MGKAEKDREREREIPREENPKRLENRILAAFGNEKTHNGIPGKAGSQGKRTQTEKTSHAGCYWTSKNPWNRQANRPHLGSHDPTAEFGVGAQQSQDRLGPFAAGHAPGQHLSSSKKKCKEMMWD